MGLFLPNLYAYVVKSFLSNHLFGLIRSISKPSKYNTVFVYCNLATGYTKVLHANSFFSAQHFSKFKFVSAVTFLRV